MNATLQPVKRQIMSRDELMMILTQKYERRVYIADDIKEYVCGLDPEKAFALSRLLPKEVLAKLLNMRGADAFVNNIIEYSQQITKDGKFLEDIAKQAEELFLVTHSLELVKLLGG